MDAKRFTASLKSNFPEYGFELVRAGAGWMRIFVSYNDIQLGRISLKPMDSCSGHTFYTMKHYKPSEMPFENRDMFFYLFYVWYDTGEVPQIDFDGLVSEAKRKRRERIKEIEDYRAKNPKWGKFLVDSKGNTRVSSKRKKISRNWMTVFRKLVGEELRGSV